MITYSIGDEVEKVGGDYSFVGVIVAAFRKLGGAHRYVVEDDRGILHIFSFRHLAIRTDGKSIKVGGTI